MDPEPIDDEPTAVQRAQALASAREFFRCPSIPEFNPARIRRFVDLAKQGRFGGASRGEKIAHKMARFLKEIGDDFALMDNDALEGFFLLLQQAAGPWPTDDYKEQVFRIINSAAKD